MTTPAGGGQVAILATEIDTRWGRGSMQLPFRLRWATLYFGV